MLNNPTVLNHSQQCMDTLYEGHGNSVDVGNNNCGIVFVHLDVHEAHGNVPCGAHIGYLPASCPVLLRMRCPLVLLG